MWNNRMLRLGVILFGISTATATSPPTSIKKLTNINKSDILGSEALPLPVAEDALQYQGLFPSKVIPFQFESRKVPPLICEPLSTEKMRRSFESLPKININAYLTLPDNFDIKSGKKLILEVMLPTSNGLGPTDYKNAKVINDAGIAVCIIDYAHPDRMGVRNRFIRNPELFNNKMPALDAYNVAKVLKSVPFLAPGYGLSGFSLGASAVFEANYRWLRELVSPDDQPYRLFIATGGLPLCQYSSTNSKASASDPGTLLAIFHGQNEKYASVKAVEGLAKYSNLRCFLEAIEGVGHYHWAEDLREYTLSPAHRHHVTGVNFTPPRSAVRTHLTKPKLTYTNALNLSEAVFQMDLDHANQIPEEICRLFSFEPDQDPELLRTCLKNQPDFAHLHKELESASNEALMGYIQQVYQDKIEVTHIGLKPHAEGVKMKVSEIQSKLSTANLEVKMDPEARNYTNKRHIELLKRFCGQEWVHEHYLDMVKLTDRQLFQADGLPVNIRVISQEQYGGKTSPKPVQVPASSLQNFGLVEDPKGLLPKLPTLPSASSLPRLIHGEESEVKPAALTEETQSMIVPGSDLQPVSARLSPKKQLDEFDYTAGMA